MHGTRSYAVLAKPVGPVCNLACRYCFYLEKKSFFGEKKDFRMSSEILESYIRQYIEIHGDVEIQFPWQGGEPTLLGVDFFQEVVRLQKQYERGRKITNTFQTNGILLDDKWCAFFKENGFVVGISIDGPREIHDRYRVDKGGRGTFERVLKGIRHLKKHGVRFNTLTVVNAHNAPYAREVYGFLKEIGDDFMQFIPLVERVPAQKNSDMGRWWEIPQGDPHCGDGLRASKDSVRPGKFADFYITIFDEWIRHDVGRQFVQFFDATLGNWLGAEPGVCYYSRTCGHAAALEHNGDLYSCDHYVYPSYRLGNIMASPMAELLNSEEQRAFGMGKYEALPRFCKACEWLFVCHGECPKNRIAKTSDNEPGLNYLCRGYRRIFKHMAPYMEIMSGLVRSGRQAVEVMNMIESRKGQSQTKNVGRNEHPKCPCKVERSGRHAMVIRPDTVQASRSAKRARFLQREKPEFPPC